VRLQGPLLLDNSSAMPTPGSRHLALSPRVIRFGNSYHRILAISIPVRRVIKNILPNTI
jgi:hypothetical protein